MKIRFQIQTASTDYRFDSSLGKTVLHHNEFLLINKMEKMSYKLRSK